MAQTGYTPISIYYSATATNTPTAGNLVAGELAINTNDGVLYYKDSSGVVQSIASKAGNSGSFTNLAYTGTLTGGTGVVNLGSGQFYKDASGNVGIGTSSVNNSSAGRTVLELNNSSNTLLNMSVAGTRQGGIYSDTSSVIFGSFANIPALFSTNNTERMRIDTSGNFMVGTTGGASANNTNSFAAIPASGGGYIIVQHASGSASGFPYAYFVYNTSVIGSITQTGTTAVLYNTTSDYRLKTDATPIQNALATVEALNPVNFTWVDGRKDDGFLAHEIQAVIPNCVTGEKDAVETVDDVDADGKVIGTKEVPKYQQMDNSGVIPFLVKAIQELNAKVTALEAQLAGAK